MGRQAAVYVRISQDREGRAVGVQRQEEDCHKLAEARGWTVAEVLSDNDLSATSGRRRPAWERLLADLESGRIDAVVAYSSSRMYRRPRDLERLIELTKTRGIEIATVVSGDIDLDTADGRMIAGILAQIDQAEAERIGERGRRAKRQMIEQGRYTGGGRRPYGYRRVPGRAGFKIVQEEADIIKEIADRVIAGETLPRIVLDLNERGVRSPGGYRLRPTELKRVLTGTNGKRQSGGVPLRGRALILGGTDWPAILTEDEFTLVKAKLLGRSGHSPGRPGARKYVLSGLLYCSECGQKMFGSHQYYRCNPINGGCGKVSVSARQLEDILEHRVQQRREEGKAADPSVRQRVTVDASERAAVLSEVVAIEADIERLSDDLIEARNQTTRRAVQRALDKLEDRREAAEAKLAALVPETPSPSYDELFADAVDFHDRWVRGELTPKEVNELHEMFASYFEAVQVAPRVGKPKKLDPKRVKVRWTK